MRATKTLSISLCFVLGALSFALSCDAMEKKKSIDEMVQDMDVALDRMKRGREILQEKIKMLREKLRAEEKKGN